jgi:cytochrome bd ubiquinol oxidase subunit I
MDVLELSRLQFALTALYHFLFVPLTLGLSLLLAIMESVYVMSGRQIYKDMTQFWGKLFAINFAMGVATGVTMEFQFGTNWSYYSHYVGDIFGAPLAIEGLMAFFLESTFVGLFFFGWDRMSKVGHCAVTWLVALGSNLSALWILIANGWMQHPVGAIFNPDTMRMELTSFSELILNPVAQSKFVHTVSAGYVCGAMFVLGVSSMYLLRGRHVAFAKRSFIIASAFGLLSILSALVLGDESGYLDGENQKMKIAAMEAMWQTEPAPAGISIVAWPDVAARRNDWQIRVPFVLGLIATRSIDTVVPGIEELVDRARDRIKDGLVAYQALQRLRDDRSDTAARKAVEEHSNNLGYALLLKRYTDDPASADAATIDKAANDTIPNVLVLFWSFRIMVGLGLLMLLMFGLAFWASTMRRFDNPWLLRLFAWGWFAPWIAIEFGWIVAEHGRQPWAIDGVLPTALAVSSHSAGQVWFTLAGFVLFYTALLVIDVVLMRKYIVMGPVKALQSSAHSTEPAAAPAE